MIRRFDWTVFEDDLGCADRQQPEVCRTLVRGTTRGFSMDLSENVTVVFHGFLNLANLEKLQMVEEINDYFDSTNREPIRAENELNFANVDLVAKGNVCKCCGR